MKEAPKYEELKDEVVRLKERIAYLEHLLFGVKSDRLRNTASANEPGLFDEWLKEAMDEKASKTAKAKAEIEKEAEARRSKPRKKAGRPSKYQNHGLEERVTVIMPEGVEAASCDIIGKDVRYHIDNNPVERNQRMPVIGRMNCLFSKNDVGLLTTP